MLSLIDEIDFTKSKLLIFTGRIGLSSFLASKMLIYSLKFKKIGLYFSEYTGQLIMTFPNDVNRNGELYFNSENKVLLLSLTSGVPAYYQKPFFVELNDFISKYSFSETILISGFSSEYQNDTELNNLYVTPYYLTNKGNDSALKVAGIKSFVELCNLKKEKTINNYQYSKSKEPNELEELKFISNIGFVEKYLKFQKKSKLNYAFIGSYVREPFDVEAALSLFINVCNYLGFKLENNKIIGTINAIENGAFNIKVKKGTFNKSIEAISELGISADWSKIVNTIQFCPLITLLSALMENARIQQQTAWLLLVSRSMRIFKAVP